MTFDIICANFTNTFAVHTVYECESIKISRKYKITVKITEYMKKITNDNPILGIMLFICIKYCHIYILILMQSDNLVKKILNYA